jgi:hypothetical protein
MAVLLHAAGSPRNLRNPAASALPQQTEAASAACTLLARLKLVLLPAAPSLSPSLDDPLNASEHQIPIEPATNAAGLQ